MKVNLRFTKSKVGSKTYKQVKTWNNWTYRCHNWAFKNKHLAYQDANKVSHCMKTMKLFVPLDEAVEGDFILFYDESIKTFIHYGIIHRIGNTLKDIVVRSKWGPHDVMEHDMASHDYTNSTHVFFLPQRYKRFYKVKSEDWYHE